jgi:hypothetical protein
VVLDRHPAADDHLDGVHGDRGDDRRWRRVAGGGAEDRRAARSPNGPARRDAGAFSQSGLGGWLAARAACAARAARSAHPDRAARNANRSARIADGATINADGSAGNADRAARITDGSAGDARRSAGIAIPRRAADCPHIPHRAPAGLTIAIAGRAAGSDDTAQRAAVDRPAGSPPGSPAHLKSGFRGTDPDQGVAGAGGVYWTIQRFKTLL